MFDLASDEWCRAMVLSRGENTVRLFFVDFGNCADIEMEDVRRIPEELKSVAMKAHLCRLSDARPDFVTPKVVQVSLSKRTESFSYMYPVCLLIFL